jgi:hypothetical protein
MFKLRYVWLMCLFQTSAAGGPGAHNAGAQAVSAPGERALSRVAPNVAPPYQLYLPMTVKNYIAGYVVPFGVDMYDGDTDALGRQKMQAAGSGWMTVHLSWSSIEPTPPISGVHTYDWSSFDDTATRAQAVGMSLFVLFTDNPAWAATLRGGPVLPQHVADLNSVVAAAAERYDGDGNADLAGNPIVNYWSFYAEPDNNSLPISTTSDKGYWGDTPGAYADMIAGVATAMHAANPKAVVMIGGLAYDGFTPTGHYVKAFLGGVLDALNLKPGGAAAYLGAVAFHYYPINTVEWPSIKEKIQEIRGILTARGLGSLSVIVPEMGYWSEAVPGHPEFNSNETKQAEALVQMFVRGLAMNLQEMSWFMVFDSPPGGTEAHGLFRGTDLNSPKPSYTAYATLVSELYGAEYVGPLSGPGLEGYVFKNAQGLAEKVVWASKQATANVSFHKTCVRVVGILGGVTLVGDGNPAWDKDGVVGQITLQVSQDRPIYVSDC